MRVIPFGAAAPSWRELTPEELVGRAVAFCAESTAPTSVPANLEIEHVLDFLGRGSLKEMHELLHRLRQRSEPLVHRFRVQSTGSVVRQRYLLVGNPKTSSLAQLARIHGFVAVAGPGIDYLAVIQIERRIPIGEIGDFGHLRQAYEALPDRDQAHIVATWDELPTLP